MSKLGKLAAILLLLAAAACCAALLLPRPGGSVARITLNGQVLYEIDLSTAQPQRFTVTGEAGSNTIQVEEGRIRVEQADCPDQVCVDQGWISDSALPIVCLPNKLIIEITGGGDAPDAAVK